MPSNCIMSNIRNTDLFPGIATFPAFRKNHCFARASMVLTRARAQYFSGHYLKVIKREKANILHGHFSWESWRNFGLIKKTGLPLVTTFYGLDVNKLARLPRWRRRYKLLFQRGEVFTVEGPHMAAALGSIGCPENKIRVVPIGVDVEKISASVAQKDPFVIKIMFVGLEREKKARFTRQKRMRSSLKNIKISNCIHWEQARSPLLSGSCLLTRKFLINAYFMDMFPLTSIARSSDAWTSSFAIRNRPKR